MYFLWTPRQINKTLKADEAELARTLYGVTEAGNYEHSNILNLAVDLGTFARQQQILLPDLYLKLDNINSQLLEQRKQRIPLFRDNKILISWNAMMIKTLAIAGEILQQPDYQIAAEQAAEFIWRVNRQDNGNLWRVNLRGKASVNAIQEDYAYLAEAYITLYDITGNTVWLERAQALADLMVDKFWDTQSGGFYMNTISDADNIMVRPKISRDSTLPSANAIALKVLASLSKRLSLPKYANTANSTLAAFSAQLMQTPMAYISMLLAATELHSGESGARQYAGRGAVKVIAQHQRQEQHNWLSINVDIKPGWHINSHQPLQDYLIATSLETADSAVWKPGQIRYPVPEIKRLGFQRESLSLYKNNIQITIPIVSNKAIPKQLDLLINLQACDDKICLPPETLTLNIPALASVP